MEFRYAERKDTALILKFIKELADYEKCLMKRSPINKHWKNGSSISKEIGFLLFLHNFSTFLGRVAISLEDLYVKPPYRGKGYGKAILKNLLNKEDSNE